MSPAIQCKSTRVRFTREERGGEGGERERAGCEVGRKGERNETRRWGSDRRETYFFIITPTKLIFLTHRVGFQMVASPPFPSPPFLPPFSRSLPSSPSPSLSPRLLRQEKLNPELVVPFLYARTLLPGGEIASRDR